MKVYAVDLRNHGDSPHDADVSYKALSDDLQRFLTKHQLQNIDLLGHSMGGKTAMVFALTHVRQKLSPSHLWCTKYLSLSFYMMICNLRTTAPLPECVRDSHVSLAANHIFSAELSSKTHHRRHRSWNIRASTVNLSRLLQRHEECTLRPISEECW